MKLQISRCRQKKGKKRVRYLMHIPCHEIFNNRHSVRVNNLVDALIMEGGMSIKFYP